MGFLHIFLYNLQTKPIFAVSFIYLGCTNYIRLIQFTPLINLLMRFVSQNCAKQNNAKAEYSNFAHNEVNEWLRKVQFFLTQM